MLIECENCEFYLSEDEKFCLNCGYPSSGFTPEAVSDETESNFNLTFACLTAILAGGVYLYYSAPDFNDLYALIFYLILGFLGGVILSIPYMMIVNNRLIKRDYRKRYSFSENPRTLVYREETILQKSRELDNELRKIERLQGENKVLPSERTTLKLQEARESVLTQIALCELQKERISIIRLQNGLLPVLYETDDFESKEALNEINKTLRQLKKIRLSLTNDYAIEFPKESLKEKEIFLEQMENTAEALFKLRDDVIRNQVADSLENVQNSTFDYPSDDLGQSIETFNIQTSLTEFDDSYKRFETDYFRLKLKITDKNL